jgi:hypothetical protein
MSKGSVHDLLYGSGKTPLSFKRKMLIAKQAALGMNWYKRALVCGPFLSSYFVLTSHTPTRRLHCSEPPFIHRDLKSGTTHTHTHTHDTQPVSRVIVWLTLALPRSSQLAGG